VVRRVFRSLQLVPNCGCDSGVQGRAQGLPNIQRGHPLPRGQASARHTGEKAGEGAGRANRTQETAVSTMKLVEATERFFSPKLAPKTGARTWGTGQREQSVPNREAGGMFSPWVAQRFQRCDKVPAQSGFSR